MASGVSGSLRKKGYKEITHLNTVHGGQKYLLSPRGDDGS